MIELLSEHYPIARKEHECHACLYLWEDDWWRNAGALSISEFKAIIKARNEGNKILRGEKYLRQNIKQDGQLTSFTAKIDIDKICHKHDIYPDQD